MVFFWSSRNNFRYSRFVLRWSAKCCVGSWRCHRKQCHIEAAYGSKYVLTAGWSRLPLIKITFPSGNHGSTLPSCTLTPMPSFSPFISCDVRRVAPPGALHLPARLLITPANQARSAWVRCKNLRLCYCRVGAVMKSVISAQRRLKAIEAGWYSISLIRNVSYHPGKLWSVSISVPRLWWKSNLSFRWGQPSCCLQNPIKTGLRSLFLPYPSSAIITSSQKPPSAQKK
jgi:hypothetical protein